MRHVRKGDVEGIAYILSRGQELFSQRVCFVQLAARKVKSAQSHQHLEALRSVADAVTQCLCPGIGRFYLWGSVALGV